MFKIETLEISPERRISNFLLEDKAPLKIGDSHAGGIVVEVKDHKDSLGRVVETVISCRTKKTLGCQDCNLEESECVGRKT